MLSTLNYGNFDINHPENRNSLQAMQRIAQSVRVLKVSKIDLTDFFSLETNISMSSYTNSIVYISINFLRHEEVLYTSYSLFII